MSAPLTADQARRRLLLLSATRWLPVGLSFGLTTLIPLQRGLDLASVATILSVQGFVVLALELPTGGLADTLGRRPLLVLAAVLAVAAGVVVLLATGFWGFLAGYVVQGVFRALDSGPLEAWYVDTAQADDPEVAVEQALSRAASVLGFAIAGGAAVSGLLVAWHPFVRSSALLLPLAVATGLYAVHALLAAVLLHEPPRRRARAHPGRPVGGLVAAVTDGVRLLRHAPVLRALVLVEVFWSVGSIGVETFTPVRLAELVGGENRAGTLFGPAAAAGWALFALGSALGGRAARRFGVAWTAVAARLAHGAFVVLLGLAAGPVGLVAAFWLAYLIHGSAGPVHSTLLHRQARAANRATVLSINSMVAGGAYSVGLLVLGPLATHTSTGLAVVVAGAFSLVGALLYRPAVRQERAGTHVPEPTAALP